MKNFGKKIGLIALVMVFALSLSGCLGGGEENTPESKKVAESGDNLQEIMKSGGKMKCVIKAEENEIGEVVDVVMYIDGEDVKTETTFTENGKTQNMYALMDGDYVYTWGDMMQGNGTKMNWQKMKEMGEEYETDMEEEDFSFDYEDPMDFEDDVDYSCEKWNVDKSKFELPAGVNFVDVTDSLLQMNESLNSGGGFGESMKEMCGMCDMAGDESQQAECRNSLGC